MDLEGLEEGESRRARQKSVRLLERIWERAEVVLVERAEKGSVPEMVMLGDRREVRLRDLRDGMERVWAVVARRRREAEGRNCILWDEKGREDAVGRVEEKKGERGKIEGECWGCYISLAS